MVLTSRSTIIAWVLVVALLLVALGAVAYATGIVGPGATISDPTPTPAPSMDAGSDNLALEAAKEAKAKAEEDARLAKEAKTKAEDDARVATEKAEEEAKARQEAEARLATLEEAEDRQDRGLFSVIGANDPVAETGFLQAWPEDEGATVWYRSPFTKTTDVLTDVATLETLAEPGVLLDATAAFDHMSAVDTPLLVPEGGYAYIAVGGVTLSHNGASLTLNHQEKNIYLIIVRGLPSDGADDDLNQVVLATNYVRATGIYSPMPAGAYVSLGWFTQQVLASYRDPNCGGNGCQKATAVIVDLATHSYRAWSVEGPKNPRNWTRVK